MAALNFPSSPTVGQIYSANGGRWKWDGVVWVVDNFYNLDNVTDVVITSPTDNQTLTYDAASQTWINETVSSGAGTVTSVSGTGTVSGLTLTGSITGSGSLTLGGTLSLTSGNVTTALGFTPYNATNPSGFITSSALSGYLTSSTAATTYQPLDGDLTAIAALAGTTGIVRKTAADTYTLDTSSYLTGITSGQVTTALGFTPYNATNPSGYTTNTGSVTNVTGTGTVSGLTLTGDVTTSGALTLGGTLSLTSGNVTTALGFTPYNATNPSGYITSSALSPYLTSATAATTYQPLDGDLTAIAAIAGTTGLIRKTAADTYSLDTATYLTSITSGDVTTALGFTPYNATNPSGYISGITSGNVTTALGFTPYNATNPSGYITSSALSPYLTSATAATAYQPLDGDLTAIAALAGTTGIIRKTAADTYTLDTATYLTGITSGQVTGALGFTPENTSNRGIANGYATLDGAGKVPATQLPSYVDDVLEFADQASFPATGTAGLIYVTLDTNKTFRWGGSSYVEISASPGSTDAVAEGTTNLYFTQARARASISATQNISYNTTTGVLTGPDLSGYLTSITSGQVTTALGFTPYNATNPSGFITAASPTFTGTVVLPSTTSIGTITSTELGYIDGVTSSVQTQLDGKVSLSGSYNYPTWITGLQAVNLKSYTEHKEVNAAATGTVTLDLSLSNVFHVTLTGNTTFVFSNPPANTKVFSFSIIIIQDATGSRTITWPTSRKFSGGVTPPPTTAANAVDVWSVMTYDGGTSYIVSLSVKDAK